MMPHRIAITPVERGVEGGGNMGRRRIDVEGEGNDVAEEEKQDEEDEKEQEDDEMGSTPHLRCCAMMLTYTPRCRLHLFLSKV